MKLVLVLEATKNYERVVVKLHDLLFAQFPLLQPVQNFVRSASFLWVTVVSKWIPGIVELNTQSFIPFVSFSVIKSMTHSKPEKSVTMKVEPTTWRQFVAKVFSISFSPK